jgi:copper homeostasis protein
MEFDNSAGAKIARIMRSMPDAGRILLEIIVSSLDDARAAAAGGADRFEMCSALALGGLTPSLGLLAAVKREVPHIPVMFMIRPREAGMAYTAGDLSVMERDAQLAVEHGADGLVFGVLTDRGEVDAKACERLTKIARRRPNLHMVFHRAFDVVVDPKSALQKIIDLGVTRILTSGRARLAEDGLDEIRRTREQAAGLIEILPGGGIHPQNVARVIQAAGVDQVHLSLTRAAPDTSAAANSAVRFAVDQPPNEMEYRATDESAVRQVRAILDGLQPRSRGRK